ncbi:MAG TPA: efflux RND transporter permease subunit [Armatimonadota bacterium]|nr:efflux RND transporter permease subunit [Armatimonadota bacterium]
MGIARFSVNRPVAVTMRIAAIVLLGLVCVTRLPVDLLPNVSIPTVAVVTNWPNVSPEEIETQVTRPVEEAVSSVPNMYLVTSDTKEGFSVVRVQFQWGTDIGQGAVDVLQLVQRAKRNFPSDPTLEDPIVFKYDPSQLPIQMYGVSGINDPVKLRTLLDNEISPMVESADGVAAATVTGGDQRAIIVNIDPDRLRAHNIALSTVVKRLAEENLNIPAGIAKESDTEYTIRSIGWFNSPQEIREVPIGVFNGAIVSLGDIATVTDSHAETRLHTRLNDKPSVALVITKQSGANTISTAKAVEDRIQQIQKLYPQLKFKLAYDQSQYIANSINDLKMNAIFGGTLAILILMFFLRNIRSTLVVAMSIPISIISTFALLYLCGFTLNTMSLGGLALATGLIVDDAVVVLENIFRHIERDHKSPWDAAISGTSEIMSAVLASTFTVMIVFLPLMLIKGQAGQMFTQFALVVIFSIAVSFLDATTVVPMLASRLIDAEAHRENARDGHRRSFIERMFSVSGKWFEALDESYRNGLRWALSHRLWVIGGALGITALSLLLIPQIGVEMMPQTDSGDFTVRIKLPVGTALSTTDKTVHKIEKILLDNPNVSTVLATSGTMLSLAGGTTALTPYQGELSVRLKDVHKESTAQVMAYVRKKCAGLAGVRTFVTQFDLVSMLLTGGNQNLEVDVFGDDLGTLSKISKVVMAKMRTIPGLENIDVNWDAATPEIQWTIDRQKALQMGVTFSDVSNTINTATNGTIASYYQEKGFQFPIIVQLPEADRKTIPEMENLTVTPSIGAPAMGSPLKDVTLSQVATPHYGLGPSEITRQDRARYIAISGVPQGRSPGEIQADLQKAMDSIKLPQGYHWDWGINQKRRTEEFGGMGLAIALAICLIYILLAAQFESFIHPLTVLTSVPLSAVGIILGLFLTNRSFGLTAMIGMLMLVGIVVKNGILLVDYTNVLRSRGMSMHEAVLVAGPTRLRPILMTASAATLGMLPIAIAIGKGSEINAPMATAVIGGLITSTFLTLLVVPTVYTLFDDLGHILKRRRSGVGPQPGPGSNGHSPDTNGHLLDTNGRGVGMNGGDSGSDGHAPGSNGHGPPSNGHGSDGADPESNGHSPDMGAPGREE